MHKFGKDKLITPWTMRKRVQEGVARKKTNLKIGMHLSHIFLLDYIWFAHGFPTSTYTQKEEDKKEEDNLTSFIYFNLMQLHLHKFGAKLKIQDFIIGGAKPLCFSSLSHRQCCPILKRGADQLFRASTLSKTCIWLLAVPVAVSSNKTARSKERGDQLQLFLCSSLSQRQSCPIQKRGESVPPGPSFTRTGCPMVLYHICGWCYHKRHPDKTLTTREYTGRAQGLVWSSFSAGCKTWLTSGPWL